MAQGLRGRALAKLELRNPCGSVKDRLGVAPIEEAEREDAIRRYRLILTMPETMSTERVALLEAGRSPASAKSPNERKPGLRVVAVEPTAAAVLSGGQRGTTSFPASVSASSPRS